jgi:hypothetical protein
MGTVTSRYGAFISHLMSCVAFGTLASGAIVPVGFAHAAQGATATPIKHVIVLMPKSGDSVANLLSKRIINADGTPGPNFNKAAQFQAIPPFKTKYFISQNKYEKAPYQTLPAPTLNFAPTKPIFPAGTPTALLSAVEPSLDADDLNLLTTGAATQFAQTFVLPDPTRASRISLSCRTGRSRSKERSFPTTPTPVIRPIACSRCGSSRIAISRMRRARTLRAA